MDENIIEEILTGIFSQLEPLDAQSAAILQLLKAKGLATDEELAPFLEQARNASNVRWLAARLRIASLLTSALKPIDKPAKKPEEKTENTEEKHGAKSEEKAEQKSEGKPALPDGNTQTGRQPESAQASAEQPDPEKPAPAEPPDDKKETQPQSNQVKRNEVSAA